MFDVACWKPPFAADSLAGFGPPDALAPAPGDVVLVRLTAPLQDETTGAEPHPLVELVHELRVRCSACPVVLWIPHAPPQVLIDAVRAGTQAQVRAILGGEPPDPGLLRAQLTHPGGLSTFVLRWASDAGYLPPGVEQEDVRELLDAPPSVRTLQRLSLQRQVAARTWRSRLQQLGLPNPHA
ncbi:MAG TPA: hypothetical protein VFQ45_23595, partial [Longimicrobium sp.]|nr:hypothetical protein [Longimicrobium sp.]